MRSPFAYILGFFAILFQIVFVGSAEYSPSQQVDDVSAIELLDTSNCRHVMDDSWDVLYVLDKSEYAEFWARFKQIEFARYYSDPSTKYGDLAVRICYQDGSSDIVGLDAVNYYVPGEGFAHTDSSIHIENEQYYVDMFFYFIEAQAAE